MAEPCTKEYWQGYRDCRTCFINSGIKECEIMLEYMVANSPKESRYRAGWRRYIEYNQGRQIR